MVISGTAVNMQAPDLLMQELCGASNKLGKLATLQCDMVRSHCTSCDHHDVTGRIMSKSRAINFCRALSGPLLTYIGGKVIGFRISSSLSTSQPQLLTLAPHVISLSSIPLNTGTCPMAYQE